MRLYSWENFTLYITAVGQHVGYGCQSSAYAMRLLHLIRVMEVQLCADSESGGVDRATDGKAVCLLVGVEVTYISSCCRVPHAEPDYHGFLWGRGNFTHSIFSASLGIAICT